MQHSSTLDDEMDCRRCRLSAERRRVVVPDGALFGVMAVGEAPGADEDEQGVGFVGAAGRNLDAAFEKALAEEEPSEAGVQRPAATRHRYARANVVRCRPPENRKPRADEVAACAPWLDQAIEEYAPRVLLAVGRSASERLVGKHSEPFLQHVQTDAWIVDSARESGCEPQGVWSYRGVAVLSMPHTSPLAWNRRYTNALGESTPIRELGEGMVRRAVWLARERLKARGGW